MLTVFLATFGAVFIAEIVGDKLLYTTGVLATRYRAAAIVAGVSAAFMLKMGVAVLVGQAISQLPKVAIAAVTALSFAGVAYTLFRKSDAPPEQDKPAKGVLVSFAAIFFSEWADVGMITAATMAANNPSALLVVWLGAVGAMVTKGVLAAFLGVGVRRWLRDRIQPRMLRYAAVIAIVVLGIAAVAEDMGWIDDEHG